MIILVCVPTHRHSNKPGLCNQVYQHSTIATKMTKQNPETHTRGKIYLSVTGIAPLQQRASECFLVLHQLLKFLLPTLLRFWIIFKITNLNLTQKINLLLLGNSSRLMLHSRTLNTTYIKCSTIFLEASHNRWNRLHKRKNP